MALASIVLLRDSLIEFVVSHLFCYCSIACQTTRFLGHKSFMVCTGFFSFTACMSCKNEKKNEFYVSLHPPIDYKTTHSTTNSRSSIEISILRYTVCIVSILYCDSDSIQYNSVVWHIRKMPTICCEIDLFSIFECSVHIDGVFATMKYYLYRCIKPFVVYTTDSASSIVTVYVFLQIFVHFICGGNGFWYHHT